MTRYIVSVLMAVALLSPIAGGCGFGPAVCDPEEFDETIDNSCTVSWENCSLEVGTRYRIVACNEGYCTCSAMTFMDESTEFEDDDFCSNYSAADRIRVANEQCGYDMVEYD